MKYIAAFFVFATLLAGSPSLHAETLDNPSDEILRTILTQRSGSAPHFETMARQSDEFQQADPFDKKAVLEEQIAKAKTDYETIAKIDSVRIPVRANMGQYDFEAEGFPVSLFAPGYYIAVGPGIRFTNAMEFRTFKVEGDKARDLADMMGEAGTGVTAMITLTDLKPATADDRQLEARIASVEYTIDGGQVLGTMEAEEKTILADADLYAVQDAVLERLSLPVIGTDLDAARALIKESHPAHGVRLMRGAYLPQNNDKEDIGADSKDGDHLAIVFAPDMGTVSLVASNLMGGRSIISDSTPVFGNGLKCTKDVATDACGAILLTKIDGSFVVTDAVIVQDFEASTYTEKVREVFGDALDQMNADRIETDLYKENFISKYPGRPAPAVAYTGGAIEQIADPLFDFRYASVDKISAPLMIVAAQEDSGRTAIVTTVHRDAAVVGQSVRERAQAEAAEIDKASVDLEPFTKPLPVFCNMGYCSLVKQHSARQLPLPAGLTEGRLVETQVVFAEVAAEETDNIPDDAWSSPETRWFFCSKSHPAISNDGKAWTVLDLHSDEYRSFGALAFYFTSCHSDVEWEAANFDAAVADQGYNSTIEDAGEYKSFEALMQTI